MNKPTKRLTVRPSFGSYPICPSVGFGRAKRQCPLQLIEGT